MSACNVRREKTLLLAWGLSLLECEVTARRVLGRWNVNPSLLQSWCLSASNGQEYEAPVCFMHSPKLSLFCITWHNMQNARVICCPVSTDHWPIVSQNMIHSMIWQSIPSPYYISLAYDTSWVLVELMTNKKIKSLQMFVQFTLCFVNSVVSGHHFHK